MAYGSLFDYQAPTTQVVRSYNYDPNFSSAKDRWQPQYRYEVGMGGVMPLAEQAAFDDLIEGFDKESKAITDKLMSIYDSYGEAVESGNTTLMPIIDRIGDDIDRFEAYIGDYEDLVGGMRGDFLDSILVDPNAARTRNEYMSNVAAQYDQAQEAQRRQAIQQGVNPYVNLGARREFALDRAAAMAGAANQAYGDWRNQYNLDVQRQQAANEAYANMFGKTSTLYSDLIGHRGRYLGSRQDLAMQQLAAKQAQAAGYEGLAGLVENRRTQALQLGQQKAAANADAQRAGSQLNATTPGQWFEQRNVSLEFKPNYPSF